MSGVGIRRRIGVVAPEEVAPEDVEFGGVGMAAGREGEVGPMMATRQQRGARR